MRQEWVGKADPGVCHREINPTHPVSDHEWINSLMVRASGWMSMPTEDPIRAHLKGHKPRTAAAPPQDDVVAAESVRLIPLGTQCGLDGAGAERLAA